MTTNQHKNLLDFDDALLDQILKWLPLKDLLRCSRTCNKFQQLSQERFRQSYPKLAKQEVQISFAVDNRRLKFLSFANHYKQLNNVMRYVTISSWNYEINKNWKLATLTNFMLRKCDVNFHKICIVGNIGLEPFGQNIEPILRNVKTVEFCNRKGAEDEAQFLRHCRNFRKLILGTEIDAKNVDGIIEHRYRHLTHFHYLYACPKNLNAANLREFFRKNHQLRNLVWKFRMIDDLGRFRSVQCFQSLSHLRHLKHFRLCFSDQLPKYTSAEFDCIYKELNELCKRDTFKLLEIEFVRPWSNNDKAALFWRLLYFTEWKQLEKIHFYRFRLGPMIPTLRLLRHLKSIVLHQCDKEEVDDESTDEAGGDYDNTMRGVPQVQEVYMKNERYQDLTPLCMPLVRHWKNLNKIFLTVTNYGHSLDIAKLNLAREKLRDACVLTIFTNHKSLPTNLQHELVKLKCEKFDRDR